jgi:beta-lactamase superfamily II metal-dependent hydrolase
MGGCVDLLKTMPVKRIVDNGQTKDTKISQEFRELSKDHEYEALEADHDDAEFPWLEYLVAYDTWGDYDRTINENSVGMKVTDGNITVLYTGDCQNRCETELKDTADLDADVYYAGHHGSKTSSTSYALEEVTPKVVFISVGKNQYGHPSPEALERIGAYTDNIFSTQEHGTMTLTTENGILVTDAHGLVLWAR